MRRLLTICMAAAFSCAVFAQGYTNPIIKGMNPDPSVCRVGEDYYLVTSSFHYFPGVPVYHSRDLVNWELIGHALERESQLQLPEARSWSGVYAPTIRHHDGLFYMITTNCSSKGNFIVTATDPAGDWSEPIWIDMPGIDPELFWDDDGTCYYTGGGNDGIIQCKIDPLTGKKLSEPKMIWYGTGGRYPEAPHIYKKDGWYYLLISEGGTEFGHGVTIARSHFVDGPYTPAPHNPILTHFKQATQGSPIQGTGHADIVQAHDGSWWTVCLGFRIQGGQHHLLGRETFLAPVRWDAGAWPVVNATGDLALQMDVTTLPLQPLEPRPDRNDFDRKVSAGSYGTSTDSEVPPAAVPTMSGTGLGPEWSWIRNPEPSRYAVQDGFLRLYGTAADLDETVESPTFVGIRQQDIDFTAETCVSLDGARSGDKAGMTVFMDSGAHYDVYITAEGKVGILYAMGAHNHREEFKIGKGRRVWLRITGESDFYRLWYSTDGKEFKQVGMNHTRYMSSETVGGFTGIMIGLWSQSPSMKGYADFDWFEYRRWHPTH